MSLKVATTVMCLLLALNLIVLGLNFSSPSLAAVAGLKARQLEADPGFVRAVHLIVERCRVNVDLGRMEC